MGGRAATLFDVLMSQNYLINCWCLLFLSSTTPHMRQILSFSSWVIFSSPWVLLLTLLASFESLTNHGTGWESGVNYHQKSPIRGFLPSLCYITAQRTFVPAVYVIIKYFLGDFFSFFPYNIQHCFICRPSDSTVPTDAGIEPRTVATGALAVRRSNH